VTSKKIQLGLILSTFLFLTAFKSTPPKILIIGDSISIGYTPFVEKYLSNKAEIYHNSGNAQHTGTGLEKIEEWIAEENWDIIQFNWGLWDLCYRHPDSKYYGNRDKERGTVEFSPEEYAANLDAIISILKAKTTAKLIFVTTTYVPEYEVGRFKEDVEKYNQAAKAVMQKHDITVNDLYESSLAIHQKFGVGSDDVHYDSKGYKKLGKLVSNFLKIALR